MPIFEQIRERLPSLYRPADDDTHGELVPLTVHDVLRVNGRAVAASSLKQRGDAVQVELASEGVIESVEIARGRLRGSLLNLEFYRLDGDTPLAVPGAVGRLEGTVARPTPRFRERRFEIRLRRPDLLSLMMWATGRVLERTQVEATEVMRAHWFRFADQARYDGFFNRTREIEGLGSPGLNDPDLLLFPYIYDLSRIGSLLAQLPWREPAVHRERVEDYRQRIARMVALYRGGLGTVGALRRMTEAQLPVDLTAPAGLRDRPFTVEEHARIVISGAEAATRGAPDHVVGPLMRWTLTSEGHFPAPATIVIEGVTPEPDRIDPTERPVLELFAANGERRRVGIAYDGSIAPGEALRLSPSFASWLGGEGGVRRAESTPSGTLPADPTADGPWAPVPGSPTDPVTAMIQTADLALWIATAPDGGPTTLHRFDGQAWTEALTGLPAVHCLDQDGNDLLLGTEAGVRRLPLYPAEGDPFALAPAPADPQPEVHAFLVAADGVRYAATATGLARVETGDALAPFVLGADAATEVPAYALHQDFTGTLHVGTELGLFRFQPGLGHWYWYRGEERSDQYPDFERFLPDEADPERNFPTDEDVFLPPVRCIHRGPDSSLWVGTDRGIARYIAFPVRGLTYTTLLEAYPDLGEAPVRAIHEDERGLIWFATDAGVLRFDGRDWWQLQGDALVRLPTPERTEPIQWRFNRALDRWEAFDPRSGLWMAFDGEPRAVPGEAGVREIVWTDGAVAEIGTWDGSSFTPTGPAPAPLRMRYKPDETRIVDGGIPAMPRVPVGASEWRYLALEPDPVPTPSGSPAWTIEGRLLPPPVRDPVLEGRWGVPPPPGLSQYDDAAFAFNPAARVWFSWDSRHPLAVLVRLGTLAPGERIDPAILDRVWQGIEQVRPAGVRAMLAVDEEIVRGG